MYEKAARIYMCPGLAVRIVVHTVERHDHARLSVITVNFTNDAHPIAWLEPLRISGNLR
jgi:hypothetical protein